ncbi:MAG: FecR family protein [Mangrovibacterium sp.]
MGDFEKYMEDPLFLKWVFDPDEETEHDFQERMRIFPGEKESLLQMREQFRLLAVKEESPGPVRERIFREIVAKIKGEHRKMRRLRLGSVLKYAAIALLFFATGSLVSYLHLQDRMSRLLSESLLVKSAAFNTTVYLADGTQKEISEVGSLIDFSLPGKLLAGSDTLRLDELKTGAHGRNLVVVPYGKRAQLRLPDRSLVNLSAGSRLVLPVHFRESQREVYLVGEAFFDVETNREQPFLVETSTLRVRVTGTSFNVSAYPDRSQVSTYLHEGRVELCNNNNSLFPRWVELQPGLRADMDRENRQIKIREGNDRYYLLWKEGIVPFQDETVDNLLHRVEQYFNIVIRVPDQLAGKQRITGKLDLNRELPEVLEYIELLTDKKIVVESAGTYRLS